MGCSRTRAIALAVVVSLYPAALAAQETVDSASVSGRVVDQQGAVLPGAAIALRRVETNAVHETTTDREGRFRFTYLKVGQYELTASIEGFASLHRRLTLSAGSALELPLRLGLATLDTSVTVTAETPVLETARSQIAATLDRTEVTAAPVNGRNFLDLALLAPGVAPTNVASTQLFAETSAVPGAGLSVGSQRNFSNNFIVDGLSANDDAAGLSGTPLSIDAVEQFQVVTSGGQAELGRALGGYFNVVTRSGTNRFGLDAYGFFRDDRLNAANALSHTRLPMDQEQVGGSAGGPLVRDRTFYFANAERRNLDQSGLVTIAPSDAAAINARLDAVGYPGARVATGTYENPVDTTNLLGKVDHLIGTRDQVSARYAGYTVDASHARGAGGLSAPSAAADLASRDHVVSVSNTATLSPRTVNETRLQFARSDLDAPPVDLRGPAVSIAGVASFGTLSNSPTRRLNTMVQVVNNLSHQAGSHALRAGVDVIGNTDAIEFPRAVNGAYTFSSLGNFLTGTYNTAGFTQTFGAASVSQRNPNVGLYAQDEWKLLPRLTVNAGLRYDLQFLQTIRTDTNNVSPRVGFAWSPFESGRTLVRAAAGLYYDRIPLRALANALLSAGNSTDTAALRQTAVTLSPGQAGAPLFPNALAAAIPSVTLPNLTTMQPDIQNAHSRQLSVEIEQQLGARSTVGATLQATRGRDLIISINQNVPACLAAGSNNGCRPEASYANNNQYSSAAASDYTSLQLSFVQRASSRGHLRLAYTLARAHSNVGEFFFSAPIDPFDLSKDWGRADDDARHRLVVSGAVTAPFGVQVSGTMRAYSALPLNVTSGVTTLQGTVGRPLVGGEFIARNAGQGPDFFTVDLRVARTFALPGKARLQGFVEAFNLTNRANVVALNGNFGTGAYPDHPLPAFGQPTAVGDPRAVQLGLRFSFGSAR